MHNCNPYIHCSQQCRRNNAFLRYAKIKISNTFRASKYPEKKVQTLRIQDEIKLLYYKKISNRSYTINS